MITVKEVKEALGHSVDQVTRLRDGSIIGRKGYFYRQSQTCETFMLAASEKLNRAGLSFEVTDYYDHWAPFRGGDSIAKGSHFAVVFKSKE
jgi:hypothetical protein